MAFYHTLLLLIASTAARLLNPAPSRPPFPTTLTVDRVRHCLCASARQNGTSCPTALTRPQYSVFGEAGVPDDDQASLFLSEVSRPPRAKTHNIALFIAGQQRRGTAQGRANGLTGQPDGFKPDESVASFRMPTKANSLAHRLFRASGLDLTNTFASVVLAPVFDFRLPLAALQQRENAYLRYILNALPEGAAPKSVLLAGHSRGGCLALRLARRLSLQHPSASVSVTALDAVCVPKRANSPVPGELGVLAVARRSPLSEGNVAYTADFKRLFARRPCVFIDAYVTGEPVVMPTVRALSYSGFGNSTRRRNYLTAWRGSSRSVFYRESWTSDSHDGVTYENHVDAVGWMVRGMLENRRFGCGV